MLCVSLCPTTFCALFGWRRFWLIYGRKIFLASRPFFFGRLAIFVDSFSAATDCSGFYIFARGEYFRVRQKREKKGEIAREAMSVFVA